MSKTKAEELLRNDRWSLVEGECDIGSFLLRYRTPVLAPPDTKDFGRVLKITWSYADENIGALPNREDSRQMAEFESRFCAAVEHDATAILTAVLTFDGARQWVLYTGDIEECGKRLNNMPQNEGQYPLELTAEEDPDWRYLRNEILKIVPAE